MQIQMARRKRWTDTAEGTDWNIGYTWVEDELEGRATLNLESLYVMLNLHCQLDLKLPRRLISGHLLEGMLFNKAEMFN